MKHNPEITWPGRWIVNAVVPDMKGYKNARVYLWRHDMSWEEAHRLLAGAGDEYQDRFAEILADRYGPMVFSEVDQTFDNLELGALRKWFAAHGCRIEAWPASIPCGDIMGYSARDYSSRDTDFEFWKNDDWNLPFKVLGLFSRSDHLRALELDEERRR